MKTKSSYILSTPMVVGIAVTLAVSAHAAVVSINPVADAFMTTGPTGNDLSANNYGGAGAMGVAGSTAANGQFQSVMKFNLSSTVAALDVEYGVGGWAVNSASLQLTTAPTNNAIFNANAAGSFSIRWMANDSWTEGSGSPMSPGSSGINYTNLPSLTSVADASLGAFNFDNPAFGTARTWSLASDSSFIADLMAGGDVGLRFQAVDAGMSYLFHARSFGTVTSRPQMLLDIVAVPETSSTLLLPLAGFLFLGWRKR